MRAQKINNKKGHLNRAILNISDPLRKEEVLLKNEEKFRVIFERVNVGIALVDVEGRIMESNLAMQTMLGYTREELHHMVFNKFTHPDDKKADINFYRMLVEEKCDYYQMENRLIRKDGGLVWGLQNVSVVRGVEREFRFTIHMVEDITERKRPKEEIVDHQGRLEDIIKERTANLQKEIEQLRKRIKELESFNRTMVGREMRIIEMKNEVNELCKKLGIEPRYPPL